MAAAVGNLQRLLRRYELFDSFSSRVPLTWFSLLASPGMTAAVGFISLEEFRSEGEI